MGMIWVVATVNLPGLPVGTAALVDIGKPAISRRVAAGYLRVCTIEEADDLDRQAGRGEHGSPGV